MIKKILFKAATKLADLFSDTNLNSSLCLIFNGMASMTAILFIVFFAIKLRGPLLWLGAAGCGCMMLANITDLFPFWLKLLAKKLGDSEKNTD